MRRTAFLIYGLFVYTFFLGVFVYAIAFIGDLGVPRSLDSGATLPWGLAAVVNVGLLAAFALQHSGMARPAFKRWWTRFVPQPVERATYVLFTNLCFVVLFALWQPIPAVVWEAESAMGQTLLRGLYFAGWGLVLYATVLIDHFELFGVRQVVRHFRGQQRAPSRFVTPSLYRYVRHPLYLGWFVVFWATPVMTVGHLLFAAGATGYVLVAVLLEESDLVVEFGDAYRRYRATTPAFLPLLRRRAARRLQPSA